MADEQFHAAGGIVYVPDGDSECADGRVAGGLPRHAVGAALVGAPRSASTPRRSLPSSRRRGLDARRVPKLVEKVIVVVATHQVVRNRHAHSRCHRQAGIRA